MTWKYQQSETGDGGHLYELANDETGEKHGPFISPSGVNGVLARHGLEAWIRRRVGFGVANRPDLVKLFLSDGPDSDNAKRATREAEQAGKAAANEGTAYHTVSENISTAADAFNIAAELRPWAERFGRLLDEHGIVIKQREVVVVNFTHRYAGKADQFALHASQKRIGDTKTGKRPYFEAAMQLAAYANAEYALVGGELVPMPVDMDKETGLILHVPVDDGADLIEVPLVEAWEAFKHACAIKWITDGQPRGPVGEIVEPTHRFSDTYVEWIRNRLAEHRADNPAIVSMFQAWKLAAYGERPSSELTTDELEACLTALCDLEAREQLPFPSDTYPHPHGPRISAEAAEAIQSRIDALPQWCRVEVLAQKGKLPTVDQWRVVDAEEFEQVLGPAESAAASLAESLTTLLDGVPDELADLVSRQPVTEWTWSDFEIAGRLVEAYDDGLLSLVDNAVTVLPTIVDRLVERHGSKADATKAIRQRVADLGLDIAVPRSLGDCCTDPVLVALAA